MAKFIPVEPEKWAEMVKAQAENARLKAEVELWKLRSDNWQKFCELTRPEMTDELTRLKAEVERLTADIEVYKEGVMKSDNLFQSVGIFVKDEEWVSDGITQLIERANKAEAQVERLTKAGDAMAKEWVNCESLYHGNEDFIADWNDAKEGGQP